MTEHPNAAVPDHHLTLPNPRQLEAIVTAYLQYCCSYRSLPPRMFLISVIYVSPTLAAIIAHVVHIFQTSPALLK